MAFIFHARRGYLQPFPHSPCAFLRSRRYPFRTWQDGDDLCKILSVKYSLSRTLRVTSDLSGVVETSSMRRFSLGSATDRKIVVIELDGPRMSVVQMLPDGSSKRNKKELGSEADARAASERMAQELISRGFVEQVSRGSKPVKPARPGVPAAKPVTPVAEPEEPDSAYLFADVEAPVATAEPVLTRLSAPPSSMETPTTAPKKKKKKGKKKKKAANGDALDKRVLAGVAAFGALILGFFGYMIYDGFIKPPSIIGVWRGSMIEYETGKAIIHTKYDLILDGTEARRDDAAGKRDLDRHIRTEG